MNKKQQLATDIVKYINQVDNINATEDEQQDIVEFILNGTYTVEEIRNYLYSIFELTGDLEAYNLINMLEVFENA